ncbi:MAG: rhombosortase [Phycisphaerae bacterium]|nr:rhombosortase [Phycisphaerae bacterium]
MRRVELLIYGAVIAALNAPLVWGGFADAMILLPEKVAAGQWWRIFSHPFVHVSWYHLLLDGAAFFILYAQLAEARCVKRTAYVFGSALGSMLAVMIALPGSGAYGYCGLSGLGHGLMGICSLELITGMQADRKARVTGLVSLALVTVKSIIEALTGKMFLGFLHPDLLGIPISVAHIGGLLAGCAIWWTMNRQMSPAYVSSSLSTNRLPRSCAAEAGVK